MPWKPIFDDEAGSREPAAAQSTEPTRHTNRQPMEDDSGKTPQSTDGQEKDAPRRPRGLGGVVLIMLLLLALFVMVSQAGLEQKYSIYDFYRVLFNGDIEELNWQDDGKKVAVKFRNPDNSDRPAKMELLTGKFAEDDRALIRALVARDIDKDRYAGLDAFAKNVKEGSIYVQTAIFLSVLGKPPEGDARNLEELLRQQPTIQ